MTMTDRQIARTPTANLENMLDTGLDGRMRVLDLDTLDRIDDELALRDLEAELPAHDDSLDDRGQYLGSYAS